MSVLSAEDVLSQLEWRYAVKKFDGRTISEQNWHSLERSLILSASSYGVQPWKFIVVTNPALRAQLQLASWNQVQVTTCSHLVVFAIKEQVDEAYIDRYIARMAHVRNVSIEALMGLKQMIMRMLNTPGFDVDEWSTRQVYLALGTFLSTAALMGIDTCPMEGIAPARYDELLGLTGSGYRTVVAATAGYRAADDKYAQLPKVRFEARDVVTRID